MQRLAAFGLVAALAACGGTEKTKVHNVLVSPTEQREDLARAHALGIITDAEYQAELAKIDKQQ